MGVVTRSREQESCCLEAVERALLLLLVGLVQRSHACFEVRTLGFNPHARVALFLDCLERVAVLALLLLHDVKFLLETSALLLPRVHLVLDLGAGRLQVGKRLL